MPKYVLSYFPIRALGECPKLLLAYGGEGFEDRRVTVEEWPKIKPTTPFGQMPVLEFDGKKYGQNLAMCRYLGRKYGLAGKTSEEDFEIDMSTEYLNDMRIWSAYVHYEEDKVMRERLFADYSVNRFPFMLAKLNENITKNNGYMAAGRLTWGDFVFAGLYEYIKMMMRKPDLDTEYPAFKTLFDKVTSLPKVKEYYESATFPDPE